MEERLYSITLTEEELSLFSEFQKEFGLIKRSSRMHSTNNYIHNMNRRDSIRRHGRGSKGNSVVPSGKSTIVLPASSSQTLKSLPVSVNNTNSSEIVKTVKKEVPNKSAKIASKTKTVIRKAVKSKKANIGLLAGTGAVIGAGIAAATNKKSSEKD